MHMLQVVLFIVLHHRVRIENGKFVKPEPLSDAEEGDGLFDWVLLQLVVGVDDGLGEDDLVLGQTLLLLFLFFLGWDVDGHNQTVVLHLNIINY